MPTVYLCGDWNSTFFTTCCRCAITDEQANCPVCKQPITPRPERGRWEVAYGPTRRRLAARDRLLKQKPTALKEDDRG